MGFFEIPPGTSKNDFLPFIVHVNEIVGLVTAHIIKLFKYFLLYFL